ncbi:MAG: cupin domain-containing protein [Acidimicrobiales bacterium]
MDVDPAARPVIEHLGLVENPRGGWFRQVHECPHPSGAGRSVVTVINYLLDAARPTTPLWRMSADAVHYFHQGAPVAVVTVSSDGAVARQVLGPDRLQDVVGGGTWKRFELVGGPWGLISEAVAPGWQADDHELAPPQLHVPDIDHDVVTVVGAEPDIDWVERLGLEPNLEGGYYRQTFESSATVATAAGERPLLNTIYYLLTAGSPVGHLHRNGSDITHLHHHGGPATYLLVSPAGELAEVVLGPDLDAGQVVSFTAPGGWWKTSHVLAPGATDCLISEVVAPGFRYDDHQMASVAGIATSHPELLDRLRPFILASDT